MKVWSPCTRCGANAPYGCRTCRPPMRLTQRGHDVVETARLFAALLLSLAVAGLADGLIR